MPNRRTLLSAAGSGALALLSSTRHTIAQATTTTDTVPATNTKTIPIDPFILLLRGIYESIPVRADVPDLGLSDINLAGGSWSRTRIYPVFGVPRAQNSNRTDNNVPTTPIGSFYPQLSLAMSGPIGNVRVAYDLPHGAIAMQFLNPPNDAPIGYNAFDLNTPSGQSPYPDGQGGYYLEGTWELSITDATGIYKDFIGGHNHMVERASTGQRPVR
jgi:hypothetical protein